MNYKLVARKTKKILKKILNSFESIIPRELQSKNIQMNKRKKSFCYGKKYYFENKLHFS